MTSIQQQQQQQHEMQHQHQLLEEIVRLNNKGLGVLVSSKVRGREALRMFQTALTMTVDLAEDHAHFHAQQQQPGNASTTTTTTSGCGCHCRECSQSSSKAPAAHPEDYLAQLCRAVTVPMSASAASSAASSCYTSTTSSDAMTCFFYNHAMYLKNPFAAQGQEGSSSSIKTLLSCPSQLRALTRFYLVVLLLNSALACYQLGHAMAASSSSQANATRSVALFHKALELYTRMADLMVTQDAEMIQQEPYECAASGLQTQIRAALTFFTLASRNNYCLICLHELQVAGQSAEEVQGARFHAQQAAEQLLHLLQQQGPVLSATVPHFDGLLKEFYLNTTILHVTGFFSLLAAAAA